MSEPTPSSPRPVRAGRPTIKDVAAHAGVAFKTVSRVVNGEAGVSAAMREVVQAAIDELGFRRNASAASLRQGQTASIALVIEDIAEPIQSAIARAVERAAVARHTLLFTASSSDDETRERDLVQSLCARPVDGLILLPNEDGHAYLQAEMDAGVAIVAIDRPLQTVAVDTVLSDNREGARHGVAYLIQRGHRRVAFLGDERMVFTSAERFAGYRDALADAGIPVDEQLEVLGRHEPDEIRAALARMRALPHPPTAVFTANSLNSTALLRAVGTGHGLAHVAFDDLELFDLLTPPITAVAQNPAELGRVASEMLFERIDGFDGPPRTAVVPTRLIERSAPERVDR